MPAPSSLQSSAGKKTSADKKKRAAVYLRISTRDGRQTEENQRRQLQAFVEEQGYEPAGEYVDHESGRKGRRARSGFDAVFEAAERREFDLLVFWSLDRFSREGIRKTVSYLQQLEALGVRFRSYTEPYLSTENELVSHILPAVLSYFAEQEAKKISRRTKAGLERARAEGKKIGRPSKLEQHRVGLEAMLAEGVSKAEMKRRTGLAYNTAREIPAPHRERTARRGGGSDGDVRTPLSISKLRWSG